MEIHLKKSDDDLIKYFFELKGVRSLEKLLEVERKVFRYYLNAKPIEANYNIFEIAKKSGGVRKIASPNTNFKIILQKLNYILQLVYDQWRKPSVHGFTHNRSIVTNARAHVSSRYVFNVDLKDFFPSITYKRIKGLLQARPYKLPHRVAKLIAKLTCYSGKLPQGSPCSPVISNMICSKLDHQLQRLAYKHGCFYTRYADDITFSTKRIHFPSAIGVLQETESGQLAHVGTELNYIIRENGFEINEDKIRLADQYSRQEVTGIIVNEKLNVRREYVNQIRSMLYAWKKFGEEKAEKEYQEKYFLSENRNPYIDDPISFRNVLNGKIEFLGAVRGKTDPIYKKYRYWYLSLIDPDFTRPPVEDDLNEVSKIFISYARRNQQFVKKLYQDLTNLNADVWMDIHKLESGRWEDNIDDALQKCEIMILIMTSDSKASTQVAKEWSHFTRNDKPIIPVRHEDLDHFHFQIDDLQYSDFVDQSYKQGLQDLISKLKSIKVEP